MLEEIPKGQSRMDNPEIVDTLGTQDTGRRQQKKRKKKKKKIPHTHTTQKAKKR